MDVNHERELSLQTDAAEGLTRCWWDKRKLPCVEERLWEYCNIAIAMIWVQKLEHKNSDIFLNQILKKIDESFEPIKLSRNIHHDKVGGRHLSHHLAFTPAKDITSI